MDKTNEQIIEEYHDLMKQIYIHNIDMTVLNAKNAAQDMMAAIYGFDIVSILK